MDACPPGHVFVLCLPTRSIGLPQLIVEQPHRMLDGQRVVEPLWKPHNLISIQSHLRHRIAAPQVSDKMMRCLMTRPLPIKSLSMRPPITRRRTVARPTKRNH